MIPIQFNKVGGVYVSYGGNYVYYSPRYDKRLTIPNGYPSNGADTVRDICPTGFFCHDFCCNEGMWDNGSKMCNREASFIYYDILVAFKVPKMIAMIRWIGTFLFGGGRARKNGIFRLSTE